MEIINKCKICGCTSEDPCYHPKYRTCVWINSEHSLCSCCADDKLRNDPLTVHCLLSTSDKAGVAPEKIISQLEQGTPFGLKNKKKRDVSKNPQNQKGRKKPPLKPIDLEIDMKSLGEALQYVRESILGLSPYRVSVLCSLPNDTVRNIERGASEVRNLLKYCKGLELDLKLGFSPDGLKVTVFHDGSQVFPTT